MDMEFGGICGTWQRMKLPVEAGVVIHDPRNDSLLFAEKKFSFDLDVTVWKNITDDLGRTVGKNPCTINPARNIAEDSCVKKVRLDSESRQRVHRVSRDVHDELKEFMGELNSRGIRQIVFFAADYEKSTLARARVNLAGFVVRDLQQEIKSAFSQKEVLSLDRLSHIIGVLSRKNCISSLHYSYPVPAGFSDSMRPHDAIGDAARIFLAAQEFNHYPDELDRRIGEYLARCDAEKRTRGEERGSSGPEQQVQESCGGSEDPAPGT